MLTSVLSKAVLDCDNWKPNNKTALEKVNVAFLLGDSGLWQIEEVA